MQDQVEYVYTGQAADAESEKRMRAALATPMIQVGNALPQHPSATLHREALAAGLPEIPGTYGYDFKRHEFIRLPDAQLAPPVAPEHTRILKMLADPELELRAHLVHGCGHDELHLKPKGSFDASELLDVLTTYRASLVTRDALAAAQRAVERADAARREMHAAVAHLPEEMRKHFFASLRSG